MAKRRSLEQVLADATTFAKTKPFTAQELAAHLGVTPNRARQVLESLAKKKVVGDLGKRSSLRGKPATLWGTPGTKLTAKDTKARPAPKRRGRKPRAAAKKATRGGGDLKVLQATVARLEAVIDSVVEHGVVIEGPGGLEFTVKLAGGRKGSKRRGRRKK